MNDNIYDGAIWKEFKPLFLTSFSLAVMLNVDWFQPYSHTVSSVGVIYLTIMNLPRQVRSKRENIILVGLIPGPDEPKHDINTYLEPLVEELLLFWKGLRLKVAVSSGFQDLVVKCVLLCVACDLPAVRKVCGFLSCNAAFGCSKCMKRFPGSVGNMNFSGFDRSNWPHRTNQAHRKSVNELKKCLTKSSQAAKESEIGSRYSVLLDLPYFDPVRMHVIDVMHNMFLGTMKHMVKIWIRDGVLLSSHFEKIQECVDSINVPADVG